MTGTRHWKTSKKIRMGRNKEIEALGTYSTCQEVLSSWQPACDGKGQAAQNATESGNSEQKKFKGIISSNP